MEKKYDLVINLAAIVGGREVIENNPLAVAEDLEIDTAFWRWAVKNKKIGAAYPVHLQTKKNFRLLKEQDIDFSKDNLGKPDLSYGWAKLNNEYLNRFLWDKKYNF